MAELIHWADIIDGAQYASAQGLPNSIIYTLYFRITEKVTHLVGPMTFVLFTIMAYENVLLLSYFIMVGQVRQMFCFYNFGVIKFAF